MKYIISIDQSTTNTKVFLLDLQANMIVKETRKHQQIYPENGWVEHDAMEIYQNMLKGIYKVLKSIKKEDQILGICITNQRETTVLWDKTTGQPVYHAIVWQCRRTTSICEELKKYEDIVIKKTGLKIDPYFSATKMNWLINHTTTPINQLLVGTIDSWLLYKLTGKHICDHTNASRTLLYDLETKQWDDELLSIFDIPKEILPEIIESDGDFGTIKIADREIPILTVIGDSQSALYAHGIFAKGDVKITLGTGSSIMMNQGESFVSNQGGVVTALAYKTTSKYAYAKEAIINCSADTLNWIRDDLGLYQEDSMLNTMTIDSHGVYLVPAFVGLGIPYWKMDAKACISGISRNTTKEDIIVAGLQSIAFQVYDALIELKKNNQNQLGRLSADGGASKNPLLMQFLSDITHREIITYNQSDFSAFGVYILGLEKLNMTCVDARKINHIYKPNISNNKREDLLKGWKKAIEMVL